MLSADAPYVFCMAGIATFTMLVSSTDMNIPITTTASGNPHFTVVVAGVGSVVAGIGGAVASRAGARGAAGPLGVAGVTAEPVASTSAAAGGRPESPDPLTLESVTSPTVLLH